MDALFSREPARGYPNFDAGRRLLFLKCGTSNYMIFWSPTASCGVDAAREARQVLWEVGTMWASRPLAIKKDGRIDPRK
jgi:hypothetical protein